MRYAKNSMIGFLIAEPAAAVRRAPKLDSKMKSLSLDCPDATIARKNCNLEIISIKQNNKVIVVLHVPKQIFSHGTNCNCYS